MDCEKLPFETFKISFTLGPVLGMVWMMKMWASDVKKWEYQLHNSLRNRPHRSSYLDHITVLHGEN